MRNTAEQMLRHLQDDTALLAAVINNSHGHVLDAAKVGAPTNSELITGDADVQTRLAGLVADVQFQIDGILPFNPSAKTLREAAVDDLPVLERGVTARSLVPFTVRDSLDHPKHRALISRVVASGMQIRTSHFTPIRLIIFDRKVAGITEYRETSDLYLLLTSEPRWVDALSRVFETAWAFGRPLADLIANESRDALEPDDVARSILRLLAQGEKDQDIARVLGLSNRTVGRQILRLRQQTSTSNRTALATEAVRRGWID